MKNKALFLFLLAATSIFYALWWKSTLLGDLDNKIYDVLAASETKFPSSQATVIVEIDEKSLEALGQWPWPRVVMAQLLKKIASQNPSATAVDMIFPEPDRTSPVVMDKFYSDFFHLDTRILGVPKPLADNDKVLADAIEKMNVTLPLYFDPSASVYKECFLSSALQVDPKLNTEELFHSPYLLSNLPILQHAAHGSGHIQASADNDGIYRRLPLFIRYHDSLVPTLGVAMASTIDPGIKLMFGSRKGEIRADILGHTVRMDPQSQVLLRFYPRQWYRSVSALDILNNQVDPSLFEGKFVLIGASAMGLHDHYTLSNGTILPGIFVHATLIENLLDNTLIAQPSLYKIIALFLSLMTAVFLMVLMRSRKYLYVLALFSSTTILALAVSYGMLRQNVYVSVGYFLAPLGVYLFGLAIVLFVIGYRDQKRFFEKMSKANEAMIDSMALVAETRDTETGAHIIRTKEYIRLLAYTLVSQGLHRDILTPEFIMDLYHAAPLHDVGKVGIPDDILKKNSSLSVKEFEEMKTHTTLGKEVIGNAMAHYQNNTMLSIAHNIAHYHHEKWDGSGYPEGLSGENIPLEARMMALADVYDALISRRRYKLPFSFEESEKIILQGRGTHFDPELVDTFITIKEEFKVIALRTAGINPHELFKDSENTTG
jgi:adenylate cyclase